MVSYKEYERVKAKLWYWKHKNKSEPSMEQYWKSEAIRLRILLSAIKRQLELLSNSPSCDKRYIYHIQETAKRISDNIIVSRKRYIKNDIKPL